MIMKKISDRMYEFFELDRDDYNLETDNAVVESKAVVKGKIDYSLYEYYFSEDDCLLLEEYRTDNIQYSVISRPVNDKVVNVVIDSKPKSKKDELVESLNYLKSKPNKTKQDRESIYTLEVVLKSMR